MGKPQALTIAIESHLLFELLFSFVVIFMHNHSQFEGIARKQDVAVFFNDHLDLVSLELSQEIHNKLFVVFQDDDSKFLKDMT